MKHVQLSYIQKRKLVKKNPRKAFSGQLREAYFLLYKFDNIYLPLQKAKFELNFPHQNIVVLYLALKWNNTL